MKLRKRPYGRNMSGRKKRRDARNSLAGREAIGNSTADRIHTIGYQIKRRIRLAFIMLSTSTTTMQQVEDYPLVADNIIVCDFIIDSTTGPLSEVNE